MISERERSREGNNNNNDKNNITPQDIGIYFSHQYVIVPYIYINQCDLFVCVVRCAGMHLLSK